MSDGPSTKSSVDFNLTDCVKEILTILVQRLNYKGIAAECNVSYTIVNAHIPHIYEKLHVRSGKEVLKKVGERRIE